MKYTLKLYFFKALSKSPSILMKWDGNQRESRGNFYRKYLLFETNDKEKRDMHSIRLK